MVLSAEDGEGDCGSWPAVWLEEANPGGADWAANASDNTARQKNAARRLSKGNPLSDLMKRTLAVLSRSKKSSNRT